MISAIEGAELVTLARTAVEKYLDKSVMIISEKEMQEKAGVFVTLNDVTGTKNEYLRGCIGFPLPEKPIYQGVVERQQLQQQQKDPRFPPLDKQEINNILFEVSILTPPEEDQSKPGRLWKRNPNRKGRPSTALAFWLGSPPAQVPLELKWDVEEYLSNICYKAGAPPDVWLDPSSKLYKFQAAVFKEVEPRGKVIRVGL